MATDFNYNGPPRTGDAAQPATVPVEPESMAPDCRSARPAHSELCITDLAALAPTNQDLQRTSRRGRGHVTIRRPGPAEPIYIFGPHYSVMMLPGRLPGDFKALAPVLLEAQRDLTVPVDLYLTETASAHTIFLPVMLRSRRGPIDRANASLKDLVPSLVGRWVTLSFARSADTANGEKGCRFVADRLQNNLPAPALPERPMEQLVLEALRQRTIIDPAHPALKAAQKRPNNN